MQGTEWDDVAPYAGGPNQPPAAAVRQSVPLREGRRVTVEGRARHVNHRQAGGPNNPEHILTMRVDSVDPAGNLARSTSVELRGADLHGRIGENEPVRVTGHVRNGVLVAVGIENLATRSTMTRSRSRRPWLIAFGVLLVAFVGYQAYSSFSPDYENARKNVEEALRHADSVQSQQHAAANAPATTRPITINTGPFGPQFNPSALELYVGDSILIHNTRSAACQLQPLDGELPTGAATLVPAKGNLTINFPSVTDVTVECVGAQAPPLLLAVHPR